MLVGSEDNENIGDVLFSGDYLDLINKPFILTKLADLQDYPAVFGRINTMINSLSEKDKEILEGMSDLSRFLSAIEVTFNQDINKLNKLIEACQLFEGESLNDVITNIREELGWLDMIREDIGEGKVLSEKDFTAVYEEILKSINETEEGLIGIIKQAIKSRYNFINRIFCSVANCSQTAFFNQLLPISISKHTI
jgi:superfamily I DNA/RNA helicase